MKKRVEFCLTVLCLAALLGGATVIRAQQDDDSAAEFGDQPALENLRNARDTLASVGDFTAALDPAERVLAMLEDQGVTDVADDVQRLAGVQAGLEDYESAELNYLKAITLLRERDGEFSRTLIGAHQALGRIYITTRQLPEAITVLETAQNISQRNDGLFNVEQSPVIDDLTLAHLASGNTSDARELQLERLDNAVRRFGADDPRTIPFYAHLGDYFDRSRLRLSAREQYEKALEISSTQPGADGPRDLDLLRRLTAVDLILGEDSSEARDRLETLLDRSLDLDAAEEGLSLAALGDWALVHETMEQASAYYQRAYAALREGDALDYATAFDAPKMLNFIPPLDAVDRGARGRPWAWGSVIMEFNVSANGRASDIATISMEPRIERLESRYNRRIRETHFRPRLVDGAPQATPAVRYTQSFRYYVDN